MVFIASGDSNRLDQQWVDDSRLKGVIYCKSTCQSGAIIASRRRETSGRFERCQTLGIGNGSGRQGFNSPPSSREHQLQTKSSKCHTLADKKNHDRSDASFPGSKNMWRFGELTMDMNRGRCSVLRRDLENLRHLIGKDGRN